MILGFLLGVAVASVPLVIVARRHYNRGFCDGYAEGRTVGVQDGLRYSSQPMFEYPMPIPEGIERLVSAMEQLKP